MKTLDELTREVACGLTTVLTDIDDTLTTHGKLSADAYSALWRLREAGLRVVPVTGRPAGWCDLIARQWPVDAVIGENGALVFYEVAGRLERLVHPEIADPSVKAKLATVERAVLAEVPGSRVAKDQAYRVYDLAIDFREEAPDLGFAAAEQIRAVFARHGATAKVSSIHVNGWFGNYDKLSMARHAARVLWQEDLDARRERYLFVGDSPNDEPMFAHFLHTVGVANVRQFAATMKHRPTYVTPSDGGAGFAELVDRVLTLRSSLRP